MKRKQRKKEHPTDYSWARFTPGYPKPDSSGVEEYQAQKAREWRAATAKARAEAEERARRLHEARVEAGRQGAAARWAGHKKARPAAREPEVDLWDLLKALGLGVLAGLKIFDKIRGRKK